LIDTYLDGWLKKSPLSTESSLYQEWFQLKLSGKPHSPLHHW